MRAFEMYHCKKCGKIISVFDSQNVDVICCNDKMTKLIPNTLDASKEKHLPEVHFEDGTLNVFVGEVEHPMEEEHYIKEITIILEDGSVFSKRLKCLDKPEANFNIGENRKVDVYVYCNKHGLWKKEFEI